jgi:hypothetical protein
LYYKLWTEKTCRVEFIDGVGPPPREKIQRSEHILLDVSGAVMLSMGIV